MSQQLTAIWNTYGMVGEEQERAAAVGAKMAAQTAVDFQDIATAMQSAAAPAAQMGVEYNQLAAIIATVGDVTQQSASTIGNAYKTIFSRFQQLKAEGTDGEITLSSISAQLQNLGIHVLDSAGNLRELGVVIDEVGQNWDNWTQTQQTAIAQIVGGTRQYGQFLALMENFDKYQKNLNAAATEDGSTLEQQYEQALDSIESRAENAGEAWKRAFSEVITADQIKTFYGALEQVGEIVEGILKSLGGAPGILTILIGMLSKQLIPLAGQAGAALQTLWTNRNTESRQASIRKDFSQSENAIRGNSQLSETERQIALQKNEFSKQTALINEQINTALRTATGEYRTQLEMYQQLLSKAQERYQVSLDEEQAAQRGVAAHQRALDILKESLVVARDLANAELLTANNGVTTATNEFNAQKANVSAAQSLVNSAQSEVDSAQRTVDTSASAESRAANEQKLAEARKKLAEATALLKEEEQKLAEAQKKLDAAQSEAKEAKKAKNLTDQHLAANQLINDYNTMAQALAKFDQGEMTIEELKLALDKVTSSMRDLNKTASGGETDAMREKFQDLGNDINNVADRGEELEQVLRNLAELKQALAGGFDLDLQTDAADESLEAHDNLEQSRRRQDAARRGAGNPPPPGGGDDDNSTGVDAKAVGESVMALASMAAALTTVVNTVKTLKSIWFEENDATPIEKIGMTITAVTGLLMGVVPVISLIGNEAVMTALKINTALGPLGLVILGITAALIGVIAVIGLISDAIKRASPEFKLQKAKEEAKAFGDALKEAEEEATALQEAFNKYDQVQDALKDCTRGTQEWKDALKAANDQVLEMLNTYPELSRFISKDADGLLTISKEGQNLLQERADQKVIDTQAALTLSNQNVRDRQIDVSRSNLIKDYSGALSATKTYTYNDGHGNTQEQSYTGSQISSVVNKYLEEILSSTDLTKTVQDIFDKEQLQGDVDEWVQQLQKMVPDLQELDAEILAATEAKRIENEQIAESIIQNDKALDGIKDNDAMAAGGKVYSKLVYKYYEDELKRARSRGAFNTGTADSEASFAEYAKGMKLDELDGFNVTNYKGSGSNASVVYEYIDEEGKKQTGEATAEMIARFNAAAKAGEDLSEAMVKLNNQVEKLNKTDEQGGDAGDRALGSFLANGNLENANQGEFKDIQSDVSKFDTAEDYLKNKFGEDLSEIAEMAGYNSAEEFVAAFEGSLNIDWGIIPKGLQKYEGLTLAQAKRMAEVYETAMADGGEEAAKAYTDGLDYILKDVSQKDMEKVLDQLSFIDWSNWDAGKDVIAIMDSLGYSIDTTTDEWNNFTDAMRDSFDAVPDIEKLNAELQSLNEIASDISLGDIISKEDYETLKAYNVELAKYFTILSDGSAVFTGDPLDFKQTVEETGKKALADAAKELQDTAAEVQAQYDKALAAAGGTKESLQSLRQSQNRVEQNAETGESENKYWVSDVAKQLAFLESMNFDSSKIEEWKKAITLDENGEYHSTVETLQEIGNAVDEMAPKWQEAGEKAETYQQQVQGIANQIATQAESFKQLKEDLDQLNLTEEQYSQAMGVGAQKLINAERWEGLDVDEVERYAKHLQQAADKSDMLADSLKDDEEAAEDVARATKKLNQGIDKLANGFEDWSSILEESDAASEEYCDALDGMKNAMSDILDISEDFLSDDFIVNNMDDIKLAAEGDAEAIDRLRQAALEDIVLNLELNGDLSNEELWTKVQGLQEMLNEMFPNGIEVGTSIDLSGVDSGEAGFLEKLNALILEAGMSVDQVNAVLAGMGFTANFASEPQKVEIREPDKVTTHHSIQNKRVVTMEDGSTAVEWDDVTTTTTEPGEVHEGEVDAYSLETSEPGTTVVPKINSLTKTGSGAMNNYSSSNSGGTRIPGGGTKSDKGNGGDKSKSNGFNKKNDHKKSDEIKERYTNIQSSIDKTARLIERLSEAEDDAWGAQKYRNLKLINQQLGIQAKKTQILLEQARDYLEKDKSDLQSILAANGLTEALFNSDNFVMNRENIIAQLNAMQGPLDAAVQTAVNSYNAAGEAASEEVIKSLDAQVKAAEDALTSFNEDIKDKVLAALDQVDETAQKVHDTMSDLIESIRKVMQNWVDMQQVKLDVHIAISNQDIRTAEHLVDLWGDIGTKMGWTADKYQDIFNANYEAYDATMANATKMQEMIQGLKNGDNEAATWLKNNFGEEAYNEWLNGNGKVPDVVVEQWEESVDSLQDIRDKMQESLRNMMQEWVKYLDLVMKDFDKLSDKLSKNQETLDMWGKVLEGMGLDKTVDGAKAMSKIAKTTYDTSKKQAQVYKDQAVAAKAANDEAKAALERFTNSHDMNNLTENEIIQYQEFLNWVEESENAMNEAESSFKNAIQTMVDNMGKVMEAETERLRAEFFDKNISNGAFSDWDQMLDIYNGLEDIEDLTLSDLTKNYSLDKLKNEISSFMEDNVLSNGVLEYGNQLLDEINEKLENGEKITQDQLAAYQAQFQIMQEMDAYEEMMNNKKSMRLTRDASGNYSYVYSSDASAQDKEDRLQKLKDAVYEYEKIQEDAIDKYEDGWIQTYATIGKLEEEKNTARYKNDENYRKYIDEQLRQQYEKLDFYAEHIQGHYDNLYQLHVQASREDSILFDAHIDHKVQKFDEGNLSLVMGTQDTIKSMTDFHKEFVNYITGPGGFADQLETTGDKIVTSAKGDMEEVGKDLDFMEGDYSDLAKLVSEKSDEIIGDNDEIAKSSTELRNTAVTNFNTMTSNIESNSNRMVTALNKVTAAINAQIEALQKLRHDQAEQLEQETNDWPTDTPVTEYIPPSTPPVSPTGPTGPTGGGGDGKRELTPAEQDMIAMAIVLGGDYRYSSLSSIGKYAGWGVNPERRNKLNQKFSANSVQGIINSKYRDYATALARYKELGAPDMSAYSYANAYTGGLFSKPDLTAIAERGPELVLNAEDTKNILAAVAMMRQTVQGQFGNINTSLLGVAGNIAGMSSTINHAAQAVDQQVSIQASFPGVSVAKEVEDALNSLITQAAQYNIKK